MKCHRVFLLTSVLLILWPSRLYALCGVPQPRLVCAEASHSQAVVVARFVSRRTIPSENDADTNVYMMESVKVVRGQISGRFKIVEPNDSGRADFDWKVGQQYVLFLFHPPQSQAWSVESCGNSGPLSEAGSVLEKLAAMSQDHSFPTIEGMVSTDSWTIGLAGADVLIAGPAGTFEVSSDANGRFELRVPQGTYTVTSRLKGWAFEPALLSHEDPRKLVLINGTCAQVQLEGSRTVP